MQENITKLICFLLAKFHIHKQKFTGSKPLFSVFKVNLDKYVETIQNSANLKAMKTVSVFILYVFLRCNFIVFLLYAIVFWVWVYILEFYLIHFLFVFVYYCNCTVIIFVLFNKK